MSCSGTASRRSVLAAVALSILAAATGCGRETRPPRLVLLGIDGGSWNLLDPMLARGELPHLSAIAGRGVTAGLMAHEPMISPTVWTSIASGRSPAAHEVIQFYVTRHSVRVPTVWDRFAAGGLRVGLFDWLVAWPPRAEAGGFSIPGWLRRDDAVAPPDLFERIGLPPYFYEVDNLGGPEDLVAITESEIEEKPRYWERLWEEFRPDVGAVVFYAVDQTCHRFYHHTFPQEFPVPVEVDPRFAEVIPRTLRGIDAAVGRIAATLRPEDNLVIVSDHGFHAGDGIYTIWGFDVPELVAPSGLDLRREGIEVTSELWYLGFRFRPGPAAARQAAVERLRDHLAAVETTTGEPLFDVRVVANPAGPLPESLEQELENAVKGQLPAYAFVFAIPIAPTIDPLAKGGAVIVGGERVPLASFAAPQDFSGQHRLEGIFLAAGGAIRHLSERLDLSVLDVAPLLAYLAGQPIPDDMEGKLPRSVVAERQLAAHPPRVVPAAQLPLLADDGAAAVTEYDPEIEKRLRSLGYQ
jgi:predicted AlkP superfamily phosphohydrolase/phosphomutase